MGWKSPTQILLHPHPTRQHWLPLAMMQWVGEWLVSGGRASSPQRSGSEVRI